MSRYQGKQKTVRARVQRTPIVLLMVAILLLLALDIGYETGFLTVDVGLTVWDDIALVVVALFALKGYLQGIGLTVFSLAGYLGGIIGAVLLSPVLASLAMNRTTLDDMLRRRLEQVMPTLSAIPAQAPDSLEQLHSAAHWVAENPSISDFLRDNPVIAQVLDGAGAFLPAAHLLTAPVQTVGDWLVWSLLRLIAFFVLFWMIKLLFLLVGRLFTSLSDLSAVMGLANRLAGMALGLVVGVVLVYVLMATLLPFLGSLGLVKLPESYAGSLFLTWLNRLIALGGKSR